MEVRGREVKGGGGGGGECWFEYLLVLGWTKQSQGQLVIACDEQSTYLSTGLRKFMALVHRFPHQGSCVD